MRAPIIFAVVVLCITLANAQFSVYRYLAVNNDINQSYNWQCISPSCVGPVPAYYTDETSDSARVYYCGSEYANITILMGWNIVWPGLFVYEATTGLCSNSCMKLGLEGDSSLSIFQGGLCFWGTTDFRVSNCYTSSSTTFEIRSTLTNAFNPKSFDTLTCPGTVIMKTYAGIEVGELKTFSRRIAFRNLRGNLTFPANGKEHYWKDYPMESVMELGNWPGFEPVFNVYGNFNKVGLYKTKTILSSTSSSFKFTWHPDSNVRIESPWNIEDLRPTSGPNTMGGNVLLNNTRLQIQGNWAVLPSAVVSGVPTGYNNLTYVAGPSGNTFNLAGSFNYITFFANTSDITYLTTGTFSNCNAYLTDRVTQMTWNRQGVAGVATFGTVTVGDTKTTVTLTLQNGAFAFDALVGTGNVVLQNATLTVAGIPRI